MYSTHGADNLCDYHTALWQSNWTVGVVDRSSLAEQGSYLTHSQACFHIISSLSLLTNTINYTTSDQRW